MPGGDRTGPTGMGPMTGRSAGYCAGYGVPGYLNPIAGRFWGSPYQRMSFSAHGYGPGAYPPSVRRSPLWYGRGFGRGMGRGFRGGGRRGRWMAW